jgi:hypothetical protein
MQQISQTPIFLVALQYRFVRLESVARGFLNSRLLREVP